jgi:DNA-binding XRE family transcriptional regulator
MPPSAGGRQAAFRKHESVTVLVLGGKRYVVLSEPAYLRLVSAAGGPPRPDPAAWVAWEQDAAKLGARLAEQRRQAGLSQLALARLAGIRVESLNRIERGHVTPDYGTVRRLVLALRVAGGRDTRNQPARR